MTGSPYYDAFWFVYSLKYCGEHHKPVVVMCNKNYDPNLVKLYKLSTAKQWELNGLQ